MCDKSLKHLNKNGERLGFVSYGSPDAPCLVVTHGWAADSSFTKNIAGLFPNRSVMLVDLPGYGRSVVHNHAASDLELTLDLLSRTIPENADLLCWSFSSLLGILLCSRHMFNGRLVTVCGSPCFPEKDNNPGLNQRLCDKLVRTFNQQSAYHIVSLFYAAQKKGISGKQIASCFKNFQMPEYSVLKAGINLLLQLDLRDDFFSMTNKALHIFGLYDQLVPASQAELMMKRDSSKCVVFSNSAHMPFLTEPHKFSKIVENFLSH
ncbi:MAG: alpha/beta fold hydrolase [Succinatimonas hippei]|nr:alpha/beta fold hydrolase [Succinatimonas hippei]